MATSFPSSVSLHPLLIPSVSLLACLLAHALPAKASGRPLKEQPYITLRHEDEENTLQRSDFPRDFLFGASTAALQIEGSLQSEGRGPCIWDAFADQQRAKAIDGSDMSTSIDSYRRYKEDLKHLKGTGADAYRFSISWPRIIPYGSVSSGLNQQGIDHYNNMIDILVEYGIRPVVTLYHFDLPQALEKKYGGFLNSSIVDDFKDYSEVCFKTFGDRVKSWVTINEPLMITQLGYDIGLSPPDRCSNRTSCIAGNSSTEPYIVNHNLLLCHAAASKLYKDKYQATQGGEIGISLVGQYFEPYSNSSEDKAAQERALEFELGWYMEPLMNGEYPSIMRELVKDRLPTFTAEQKKLVKCSLDFVGINYYTTKYAKSIPIDLNATPVSYSQDQFVHSTSERDGVFIGPKAEGFTEIYIYPEGLQKVLEYIKQKYQNPKIYITENGITEARDDSKRLVESLDDQHRISYIRQHLHRINKAIENGVNVKGYFYWSLFDSFEWVGGYTTRYGLYYIDYNDNLKRIPKVSALWYHDFLQGDGRQTWPYDTSDHSAES